MGRATYALAYRVLTRHGLVHATECAGFEHGILAEEHGISVPRSRIC